MIEITILTFFAIIVSLKPTIVSYLMSIYLFILGLGGPEFVNGIKQTYGKINIYPIDLYYVFAVICFLVFILKSVFSRNFRKFNATETKITSLLIVLFVVFFAGKMVNGYLDGMPFDSLIRKFINDTYLFCFFIPLVIYKNQRQITNLIYFTTLLTLIFPFCQPFLIGSKATEFIFKGQNTFRLGYGDACIYLALGALALFCGGYKKYLAFLPLTGLVMLAHRSAFIAMFSAYSAFSVLTGKQIKNFIVLGVSTLFIIGVLAVFQSVTEVGILEKGLSRSKETFAMTGTTKARIDAIHQALEAFSEQPLTGLDNSRLYAMNSRSADIRNFNVVHPHNFFINTLVNTGLIGFLFMMTLIGRTLLAARKVSRNANYQNAGAFLFSAIVFFVVFSAMNTTMENIPYLFWFLCGTVYWYVNTNKLDAAPGDLKPRAKAASMDGITSPTEGRFAPGAE